MARAGYALVRMADAEATAATADDARKQQRKPVSLIVTLIATIAGGIGGSYWSLTEAEHELTRAGARAYECRNDLRNSGIGDPADCRQAGWRLSLAHMLPWTRDAARAEAIEIEANVLESELQVAAVRDLDVAARDRAARERVELAREGFKWEGSFNLYSLLHDAGALELMVELASPDDDPHDRISFLLAAMELGDWAAAERIARMPAAGNETLAELSALVACILGDRETAATRLHEVDLDHTIARHCELPDALEQDVHSQDPARHERAMHVARLAVAQSPIAWREDLRKSEVALLEAIRTPAGGLQPVVARTRYELLGAGGPVIVAELEDGARRLVELMATAPVEQQTDGGQQILRPRESLAWGAFCLATMAAAERLWRGQPEQARAIYELARELVAKPELGISASDELPLIGLYARLDPEAAMRVAQSVSVDEPGVTPYLQTMRRLQLALVYEQAGELARALELSSAALEFRHDDTYNPEAWQIEADARWIHGALLIRAGREDTIVVRPPDALHYDRMNLEEVFNYWWTAALADPSAQALYRWRSDGDSHLSSSNEPWLLPVALELLARSAPAEHRELWLDVVSSDVYDDPLGKIRARLATAERLGDAAGIERWREREAALLARLRDDRAAALYRIHFPEIIFFPPPN